MKRWILLGLLIVTITIVTIGIISINSPRWWESMLTHNLNKHVKDINVREITIERVSLDPIKGSLVIHEVKAKLKINGKSYFVSTGDIAVEGLYRWFLHESIFDVHVLHTAIVSDQLNISDLVFNGKVVLENHVLKNYTGDISLSKVELNQIVLTAINGVVTGDLNQVKVARLISAFYEGVVTSDVLIGFAGTSTLSLNSQFDHVNLEPMGVINPTVIGQMKGIIEGQVQVTMQQGAVKAFRGRVIAPQGGVIKAEVLRYLAAYMPQRQYIEQLIANNDTIPLNKAQMETLSYNDEKFSSQIKLYSSELNLDMNITLDVSIDGGLKSLLRGIL